MDWRKVTIGEALRRSARNWPGNDFVVGMRQRINYATFDAQVDSLAKGFLGLGVGRGDHVACWLTNSPAWLLTWFACCRIGATVVSINTRYKVSEVEYILRQSDAKVLVAMPEYWNIDYLGMIREMAPGFESDTPGQMQIDGLPELRAVVLWDDAEHPGTISQSNLMAQENPGMDLSGAEAAVEIEDPVIIIYTSGTTGQPKGVMHTANSTLSHLNSWITHHKLGADDKIFMASPLAHQTGFLYAILMPVMLGVEVVLLDRWDAPVGVELIQKHGATFTMGATPFLSDIVEMPNVGNFDLSKLRTFVSAGAPIPPALVQKAAANFTFKVLSGWGMTECACPTICDPNDPDEKVWTSDGGCLPHSEVMVHGPDGKPLPQGEEGILKVRGQSMFVGYLKKPEMHGTDKDGWFDTGDQAFMHPDGYIRITGRAKDIIIRGGENIPVVEVEDVLYRHPSVAEVAVVGIPDDRMGELGCAFVTLQAGDSLDMAGMIRYLEETKTAKQYWPEHLEVIDEMPRTPSGKIQKFKLREMAKEFSR